MQATRLPEAFAFVKAGSSMAARMAMTMSSSISVKPPELRPDRFGFMDSSEYINETKSAVSLQGFKLIGLHILKFAHVPKDVLLTEEWGNTSSCDTGKSNLPDRFPVVHFGVQLLVGRTIGIILWACIRARGSIVFRNRMEGELSPPDRGSVFPTTQWTVIVEAVSTDPERARQALEKLCVIYHRPILNWFKRRSPEADAKDLAQNFVVYLLERNLLIKVAPKSGKFKCFLVASMRKFRSDQWEKDGAQKRGGGVEKVPLTDCDIDLQAQETADSQYDLDIALTIHERVMNKLAPPPELAPFIFQKDSSDSWDEIADRLKTTPTAIRQKAGRLRRKHWESFRDEVAQTVTPPNQADETRYLYELLFKNLPSA